MNLKKSWSGKNGVEKVISRENSVLKSLEVDVINLKKGESQTYTEKGKEFALIIISGKCTVKGQDFCFENIGKRKDAFDGKATAVYIGLDTDFTVNAENDVKIMVCKSPAKNKFAVKLINPEDIAEKILGKGAYQRVAHFIIDDKVQADSLYIGEFWVSDGKWASFPPHKHDVDQMPTEGKLEEIYYYEFDKESGFGVQMVYSNYVKIDETYR